MADLKISQLSAATALAGTEVVPVVQGGSTKKATIDQILAPASGKGINFAAAGGDVLTMYDEGTWTATLTASVTPPTIPVTVTGTYTRVGRQVTVTCSFAAVSLAGSAGDVQITGLPFTVGSQDCHGTCGNNSLSGGSLMCTAVAGTTILAIRSLDTTVFTPTVAGVVYVLATVTYFV